MKKLYEKIRDWIYVHLPSVYIRMHLFRIRLMGADKYQRRLELGAFWLERGTRFQLGQPVRIRRGGKVRIQYIRNLYYDFAKRKITAMYNDKPVRGLSDRFINKKKKKG